MSIVSVNSVKKKKKSSGRSEPVSYTFKLAPTDTTATEVNSAIICWTMGFTPMARAAKSSSLPALANRPRRLWAKRRASTREPASAK